MTFNSTLFYCDAASFEEILSDRFETVPEPERNADLAQARLKAWIAAAAAGNERAFESYLTAEGLTRAFVLERFSGARPSTKNTPDWVRDAKWISEQLEASREQSTETVADKLGATLNHFTLIAQHKTLQNSKQQHIDRLSHDAFKSLRDGLFNELKVLLEKHQEDLLSYNVLFSKKPVLLRLIAILTRRWMQAIALLVERLSSDFEIIQATYFKQGPLFQVHNITQLEQTRYLLDCGSHGKVYYLEQTCELAQPLSQLIVWLNSQNAPTDLKAPTVITKIGYGWSEYFPQTACQSHDEYSHFFKRLGAWFALFYVLAGKSMEQESFSASGQYPVALMLQSILQPQDVSNQVFSEPRAQDASDLPEQKDSVLTIGGLVLTLFKQNNSFGKFDQFFDFFAEGFKQYLLFIASPPIQSALFEKIENFKDCTVPIKLRPERFYALLRARLLDPRDFNDGVRWSIKSDYISRAYATGANDQFNYPRAYAKVEREALLKLQTPALRQATDDSGMGIVTSDEYSVMYGTEHAKNRLTKLNADHIDKEYELLRDGYLPQLRYASNAKQYPIQLAPKSPTVPDELFVAEASCIAQTISDLARPAQHGLCWAIDIFHDSPKSRRIETYSLYSGSMGIGLFLAAYAFTHHSDRYKKLSLAAIADVRQHLAGPQASQFWEPMGIGGATGLGSLVYGLTIIADLLSSPEILDDAKKAANLISPEYISQDESMDVIGGSAGAILALNKLFQVTKEPWILERAVLCGEHLLAHARQGSNDKRYWSSATAELKHLNGISHGASGFAYAFSCLGLATGRPDFNLAMRECLDNEDENFHLSSKNWYLETAYPNGIGARCQWCHGAVGIGLTRLALAAQYDSEQQPGGYCGLRRDVQSAVQGTHTNLNRQNDSLCCGTMGGVELFDEASEFLQLPQTQELGRMEFAKKIGFAREQSKYQLQSANDKVPLGFFNGLAGIGYTALRRTERRLPNVLLWE